MLEGLAGLNLTVPATTNRPSPFADQVVTVSDGRVTTDTGRRAVPAPAGEPVRISPA